jgi:hypothetical protein
VVQATPEEQAAIERVLAGNPTSYHTTAAQTVSSWMAAGTKLVGVLFLVAATDWSW